MSRGVYQGVKGCLPRGVCVTGGEGDVCPGGVDPEAGPLDPEADTPLPIACWDTPHPSGQNS